ncbi:hypothetical protein [Jatrophihabitans fulvus]
MSRGAVTVSDPVWDADFALELEPDTDEDLPTPQQQDDAWTRRVLRPAAYLAVAAIAAVVTVRATTGPGGHTSSRADGAVPVDGSQAPGVVITGSTPMQRTGGSLISDDTATSCPPDLSCRTSTAVPSAVARALRAAFPGAMVGEVRSVSTTDGAPALVGRYLHATTARFDITVQVLSDPLAASRSVVGSGGATLAVVEGRSGTLGVRVTVAGAGARVAPGSGPSRLAADRRLITLG